MLNLTKQLFFGIGCTFLLSACSSDIPSAPSGGGSPTENDFYAPQSFPYGRVAVMGNGSRTRPFLGAGYDATGDYLDNQSVRRAVIDLDKIPEERITRLAINSSEGIAYWGTNAEGYLASITSKNELDKTISEIGGRSLSLFTGTFRKSYLFKEPADYVSQYVFAGEESVITMERQSLNIILSAKEVQKYLSDDFLESLEILRPDQLVEEYGTHVLMTAYLGLRIRTTYRSLVADESKQMSQAAFYGLRSRQKTVFTNPSVTTTEPEEEVRKNIGGAIMVEFHGGDPSTLPPLTLTPNEVISEPMDIRNWLKSQNSSNYALSKMTQGNAVPLYDLITDPEKKAQIKKAIVEYITASQLGMPLVHPVFQAWNGKNHTYFVTYDSFAGKAGADYQYEAPVFSVYEKQQGSTVPLYKYTNKANHRFSLELRREGLTGGWQYQGIAGYVHDTFINGSVPLYEIWNGEDYAYTLEEKKQYGQSGSWKQQQTVGYVLPCSSFK